jgi:hypothetical protein
LKNYLQYEIFFALFPIFKRRGIEPVPTLNQIQNFVHRERDRRKRGGDDSITGGGAYDLYLEGGYGDYKYEGFCFSFIYFWK